MDPASPGGRTAGGAVTHPGGCQRSRRRVAVPYPLSGFLPLFGGGDRRRQRVPPGRRGRSRGGHQPARPGAAGSGARAHRRRAHPADRGLDRGGARRRGQRRPRRSAPPGPGAQCETAELDVDHAGDEPQVGRWRGVGPVQQRPRHPERAQHLQRAGMEDQRPGRPDRLRPPVDDPDDGAVVVGLQGQGQPGRARARHQDVRRFTPTLGQAPPGRVPAQHVRPVQQLVAAQPGQHHVVDRARH